MTSQRQLPRTVWGIRARLTLGDLRETVADEEDEVDERPVCGSFDLEVPEERVGAEQLERLGDDVVSGGVGWSATSESVSAIAHGGGRVDQW